MARRSALSFFPQNVWLLVGLYTIASLTHFVHNAEFIALYPNMPAWITRETVYLAYLAVAGFGVLGLVLMCAGWRIIGAVLIGLYGALGIDGLGHYALALCSQHPLISNLTIWSEVLTGGLLALIVAALLSKYGFAKLRYRHAA